jgi:ribonuclease BN (tRNA processing enzyme)
MCGHHFPGDREDTEIETNDSAALGDRSTAVSRRDLFGTSARLVAAGSLGAALLPLSTARAAPRPAAVGTAGRTKVFLLGAQGGQNRAAITGSAIHAGPSVLIMVDGVGYLMDAGVGTLMRLNEAGFDPTMIRHVFMTHHHQDHNADLGNIIGFGWTTGPQVDEGQRIDVWGPPGTRAYQAGYQQATALSIHDQVTHLGKKPAFSKYLTCHEFPLRGAILHTAHRVMSDGKVTVEAIRVNHGPVPTVGYRFKTPDLDVVFSGDRGALGDFFVQLAKGADLLFHEIIDIELVRSILKAQKAPADFIKHQEQDHSAPAFVGKTARAASAKKLVLYHIIPGSEAANLGSTPPSYGTKLKGLVAQQYAGEIVVGSDLLQVV